MANINAADLMSKAVETYRERNKTYGNSYHTFGKVMEALFPEGLQLRGVDDFNRIGVLNMIVSKLARYAPNFHNPHIDSIHDMGVYCFIQEELDLLLLRKRDSIKPFDPVFWHGGGRITDRDNPEATSKFEIVGWYYWMEDYSYNGPFPSREAAKNAQQIYARAIEPSDCQHVWEEFIPAGYYRDHQGTARMVSTGEPFKPTHYKCKCCPEKKEI